MFSRILLSLFPILPLLTLTGCSLFRANPLSKNRGAVVLVFDTRTAGDLKSLRLMLEHYEARATVFVGGQVSRSVALSLHDLHDMGCEIGLSGLRGVDPQLYGRMYGFQKYFQDEIVSQVLDANRLGHSPRYFLLPTLFQASSEMLKLPSFLFSKGFERIVHKMPVTMAPCAKPASELEGPLLHAYAMTPANFDRRQIAALARNDEILIVMPNRQVLPELLSEARSQEVPFATLSHLPCPSRRVTGR